MSNTKASGHSTDAQALAEVKPDNVAQAFGISQIDKRIDKRERGAC